MSAVKKQAHRCFYNFLRVLTGASSMQSFKSSPTAPLVSNFPLHSSYPLVPSPSAPFQLLSRQFLYPPLHVPLLQPPCHSVHPLQFASSGPLFSLLLIFSSPTLSTPLLSPFTPPLSSIPIQLYSSPPAPLLSRPLPTSSLHLQLPCQ